MTYSRLLEKIESPPQPEVATMPDGSVDRYCSLSTGGSEIETRQELGREIADFERGTFHVHERQVSPGGQSVNAAEQVESLNGDVTCYGHLDHEVFDTLSFDKVSMGEPVDVYAFDYPEGDVMFARGVDEPDWSIRDLERTRRLEDVFSVDAACICNLVAHPSLTEAFESLGEASLPDATIVFDPGDIVGYPDDKLRDTIEALAALEDSFDVVFNANRQEVEAVAAAVDPSAEADVDRLKAIREAADLTAAVVHARDNAAYAAEDDAYEVEALQVKDVRRHTGAGDHFTGALAYALGADWTPSTALALANAASGYYVATGEPATPHEIDEFVRSHAGRVD